MTPNSEQIAQRLWTDGRVSGPLRLYMLHELPARSLAGLRATCKAFKQLVDSDTGPVWQQAAGELLAAGAVPNAPTAALVQRRLVQQAAANRNIRAGVCHVPRSIMPCLVVPL